MVKCGLVQLLDGPVEDSAQPVWLKLLQAVKKKKKSSSVVIYVVSVVICVRE